MSSSPGCQLSGEFDFYPDVLLNNLKTIITLFIDLTKLTKLTKLILVKKKKNIKFVILG